MAAANSAAHVSTVLYVGRTPAAWRAARDDGLVDAPQVGELGVGEAEPLGPPPAAGVEVVGTGRAPSRAWRSSMIASIWSRNHRSMRQASWIASDGDAAAQQLADLEDAVRRRHGDRRQQVVVGAAWPARPRPGRS